MKPAAILVGHQLAIARTRIRESRLRRIPPRPFFLAAFDPFTTPHLRPYPLAWLARRKPGPKLLATPHRRTQAAAPAALPARVAR